MSAPEYAIISSSSETVTDKVLFSDSAGLKITYLSIFQINPILFEKAHEVAEVLRTRFVVATICPDGLKPEQIIGESD
jgi:hypothetical protein